MLTFKRIRTLKEIQAACKRRKWNLDTRLFDKGSDHITIRWKHLREAGTAVCSLVTGHIMGERASGEWFDIEEAEFDSHPWARALLHTIYAR